MDFSNLEVFDKEVRERVEALGDWASFALRLGFEHRVYQDPQKRLVTIVCVPTRDLFSALVAAGAVIADAIHFKDSNVITWDSFSSLADGTELYLTDSRGICIKGRVGEFNSEYGARAVEDRKGGKHFVLEKHFDDFSIRFDKPAHAGDAHSSEKMVIHFLERLNAKDADKWIRSVYPTVSVNAVKKVFKENLTDLGVGAEGNDVHLNSLLKISENGGPGSGRVLLNSEKVNRSNNNPEVAIFSTRYFDRIVRDFSASNLIIVLNFDEYDAGVSKLSRNIRDKGESVPLALKSMLNTPVTMHSMSRLMPRVT